MKRNGILAAPPQNYLNTSQKRWQEHLQISTPTLLCRLFCSFTSHPSNPSITSHFSQLPAATKYLHWCLVMARTRNVQNPTTERAEKRIPMKRKNLSPFNQVLQ